MKIYIRGRNIKLTKVVRTRVERRLGFALGRFGERIGRVLLRFSDANGHRGDLDKRCQIDVGLRPRSVRVEHTNADLFVASIAQPTGLRVPLPVRSSGSASGTRARSRPRAAAE